MKVDNKLDFNSDPFHQFLGLTLEETRKNFARVKLKIGKTTPTGINNSVHGGVLATMIDMAAVTAVFASMREDDVPGGTADLQISYLRQAHGDWLEGKATVLKKGRQLATIQVEITNNERIQVYTPKFFYSSQSYFYKDNML